MLSLLFTFKEIISVMAIRTVVWQKAAKQYKLEHLVLAVIVWFFKDKHTVMSTSQVGTNK